MGFTFGTPLILSADFKRAVGYRTIRISRMMAGEHFCRNGIHVIAFDTRGGAGEVFVHHGLLQTNALKNLRSKVAVNRRDADLRGNLDDALGCCFDEIFAGVVMIDTSEQALLDHVIQRLKGEIRIDRGATVANQRAEVMHFTRLAGFEDETDLGALAFADQIVVQSGNRHERRDGGIMLVDAAVTEDDDVDAGIDLQRCLVKQLRHRVFKALGAFCRIKQRWNRHRAEFTLSDVLEFREFLIREDRRFQFDEIAAFSHWIEQIALRPDGGDGRGDDLFTDTVDRRVGDLGEELLEVIVEQFGFV